MRRFLIFGVLVGVGILALRARAPRLHERLVERCEAMFDRMPDTLPPKRMLRGIEEIRANTARILEILDTRRNEGNEAAVPGGSPTEAVHHAA